MESNSSPTRARWLAVALTALFLAPTSQAANPPDGWRITLTASQPGQIDRGRLVIGASSVSASGYDAYDEPEPPAWPHHGLDVVTEHDRSQPGWETQPLPALRYRREFGVPLGAGDSAREVVVATTQAGNVTLSWQLSVDLDLAGHFLELVDLQDGARLDMWAVSQHVFTPASSRHRFRIEMRAGRSAPPIAHDQELSTAEDTPLAVTLTATDPQGDPLSYALLTAPAHGTLLGTPPSLTYHPAADFSGTDVFSFVASDAGSTSSAGTVTIAVLPVNDAPVAQGQPLETDEDVPLPITLAGSDADGDALSFEVVSAPVRGTLTGTAPAVVYASAPDFNGSDAFSFRVSDGSVASLPATVAITVRPVNDPPRAAFGVPGPARNAATLDSNVAAYSEGAPVAGVSSEAPASSAQNAIDDSTQSLWRSATGQTANQFLTVALPAGSRIDRVRLVNGQGTEAVKRFEVRVSVTTADPEAFTTVLTDLALSASTVQEFALPATTAASFVQLRVLENWGSTCCVSLRSFEAISDALGGIPTYAKVPSNVALASEGATATATSEQSGYQAALAIDGLSSTRWASASGQPANQSLTVTLARGKSYRVDRVRVWNASGAAGQQVRSFRVEASNTTTDPGAFATVYAGTLLDVAPVQEFVLPGGPVDARYVRFTAVSNHGSACCASIRDLEVVPVPSKPPSVSSYLDPASRPDALLDGDPATAWSTASGAVTDQFAEVRLEREVLVDRVRLLGGPASSQVVRDFEVLVSTTSDDDAAFTPVLSATNLNNAQLQEFAFPGGARPARYVRLVARNNHGHATTLSVATFEVVTVASEGSLVSANAAVVAFSSQSLASTGPGAALDQNPATAYWRTATGQTTDQWVKLRLPADHTWLVDHVALQPQSACCNAQSPRHFEVQVSTTTADDADFTTVLQGTLRSNRSLQHFFFDAVAARYVRVLLKDNYGGATIDLQTIAVYSPQLGALDARFEDLSVDLDGTVTDRAWDFGDAGVSAEQRPAHAFAAAGHYDVTLTVGDEALATGSKTQPYEALARPSASFTSSPAAPGEGVTVSFVDTSADASGVVLREWDFGDGTAPVVSTASSVNHAFADNGAYTVRLRVTNSWAASAVTSRVLNVDNRPPTVDAGPEKRLILGQEWVTAPTVNDPGSTDATSLLCHWVFGDGQMIDVPNCLGAPSRVPHTYAATGTYTATLTVTDKDGAASSDSVTVHVFPPECALAPSSTFVEFPFCGNAYTIQDLGEAPNVPTDYSGLVVKYDDPDTLLLAANGTSPEGAIYSVRVSRDAGGHITGFAAPAVLYAPVPYIDGGLVYGPQNVLFTAAWPAQQLIQLEPGSSAPDKVMPLAPLGIDSIAINFVPRGFPGACSLKMVKYFNAAWWSANVVPDGQGTFDVTGVRTAAPIYSGGPEHLLYVPDGSLVFGDRDTVLVSEYSSSNIVAYNLDANGDPVPSTRRLVISGFPHPEGMTIDPVTGDLLVSNLGHKTVKRVTGFKPGPTTVVLSPAASTVEIGQPATVSARVSDPLGHGRGAMVVTFAVASGPNAGALGTCSPNPDCTTDASGVVSFTYQGAGATGTDSVRASFQAASCDQVTSQVATVDWVSNGAPVAESVSVVTDEDVPATVVLAASDPDGDPLTFAVVAVPSHGTLSGTAPLLTYTPSADYHGADSFTFKASDGQAESNVATVSLTMTPVNDSPQASSVTVTVIEDSPTLVTLEATDPDGDALTYSLLTAPAHGALTGTAPALTYTPAPNYYGADSFAFAVSDGQITTDPVTLSLDVQAVNDAPQVAPVTVTVTEDSPMLVTLDATDPDGDALTYTVLTAPAHGTLSGTAPALTYTPAPNYHGPDGFTFAVSDGQATTDPVAASLAVQPVNDSPEAQGQALTLAEDVSQAVTLVATDVDGDALTFTVVETQAHGTLAGIAPNLTYTPAPNYHGPDALTFKASDGQVESNLATVSLTVTPVNDAPTAQGQSLTTPQGTALAVTLGGTDPDGDALTFAVLAPPAHGALSGTPPSLTYTPPAGYSDSDSFTFKANDGTLDSNVATVALTVTGGGNQVPRCSAATASPVKLWPPNHSLRAIEVQGVSDPDGDTVSVTVTGVWQDEPVNGQGDGDTSPDATLSPPQVRVERGGGGDGRVYHLDFSASDGRGGSCTGTVTTCVPKSQGGSGSVCVDGGRLYDSTQQ